MQQTRNFTSTGTEPRANLLDWTSFGLGAATTPVIFFGTARVQGQLARTSQHWSRGLMHLMRDASTLMTVEREALVVGERCPMWLATKSLQFSYRLHAAGAT